MECTSSFSHVASVSTVHLFKVTTNSTNFDIPAAPSSPHSSWWTFNAYRTRKKSTTNPSLCLYGVCLKLRLELWLQIYHLSGRALMTCLSMSSPPPARTTSYHETDHLITSSRAITSQHIIAKSIGRREMAIATKLSWKLRVTTDSMVPAS
jgi:hypothetical protein